MRPFKIRRVDLRTTAAARRFDESPIWFRFIVRVVTAAVATVVVYLVAFGWHTAQTVSRGGMCVTPHDVWTATTLSVGLTVIVAVAAWRGHAWTVAVVCVLSLTAISSIDEATLGLDDECNVGAGLWPIGAAYVLAYSAVWLGVVAAVGCWARAVFHREGRVSRNLAPPS